MLFFRNTSGHSPFRLQQDGRFGDARAKTADDDLESFLAMPKQAQGTDRALALKTSVRRRRARLGFSLMFTAVALFLARSGHLQVIQGAHYAALSQDNKERIELVVPARGNITDRNGTPLAWNEPAFVLTMTASRLPQGEERNALFERVYERVGIQPTELDLLLTRYASRPSEPIPVEDDLAYESAMRLAIEVSALPGFDLRTRTKRVYGLQASSLSHLLGYTGALTAPEFEELSSQGYRLIDTTGKTGLEKQYERLLRGEPGRLRYEVNALGQRLSILSKEEPELGSNLTLSVDVEFQAFVQRTLQETLDRVHASRASVVALDPSTGAVRALVSLPSFDVNAFTDGITAPEYAQLIQDPDQPLFFRALAGEFPSGSTLKPFVAYAAMAEGIVGEHTSFLSTGGLRIGQWFFPDWKAGGHGVTDVRKAIAESVNTYFYIIGGGYDTVTGLGVERITDYAGRFGFGAPTGIDLPSEADGFLPSKEWKQEVKGERWYVGDTYHLAIGQGDFLTTPLQMAAATATIANGGNRVVPYVVEGADGFGAQTQDHAAPIPLEDVDAYALGVVRQGMRQTVTIGSARSLGGLAQPVAGKTGTAQTPGDRPYHAWFTGFAPMNNPDLALTILIEEAGESNDSAVPLARRIFEWWFAHAQETH